MNHRKFITRNNAATSAELAHYTKGLPVSTVCKMLQRSERTIRDWTIGRQKIPKWAIAVLRLNFLEQQLIRDQNGVTANQEHKRSEQIQSTIQRRPATNADLYRLPVRIHLINANAAIPDERKNSG